MRHRSLLGMCVVLFTVFALGMWTGQRLPAAQAKGEAYAKLDIFAKVLNYVQTNYVDEVNEQDLIYGAIKGMLDTLDPHTVFLPPDVYREMKIDTTGEFFGLGLVIEPAKRRFVVVETIPGAPAARAGLLKDDVILVIDGRDTLDMPLNDAVNLMRGPAGSSITLRVQREGQKEPRDFSVARERVRMASVEGRLLEGGVGYLAIKQFQDRTATQFVAELQKLQLAAGGNLQGLIVDLRGNPGGLLDESVRVADEFLADGVIVSTVGRKGANREAEMAHKSGHFQSGKVVVLINGGSASAAEILAGALKDQKRATLIGTRSYGKGSVQNIIDLDDGSGLKITIARYFTPNNICIDGKGINPDIVVTDPRKKDGDSDLGDEMLITAAPDADPMAPPPPLPQTDESGLRLLAAQKAPATVEEADHPLRAAYALIRLGQVPVAPPSALPH